MEAPGPEPTAAAAGANRTSAGIPAASVPPQQRHGHLEPRHRVAFWRGSLDPDSFTGRPAAAPTHPRG